MNQEDEKEYNQQDASYKSHNNEDLNQNAPNLPAKDRL